VFKNLEGLLPPQPRGYYREYTVPTPGATDRGSRRLITGQNAKLYYTADHYNSFQEVIY
jgi:ribonuclease T1